MKSPWRERTHLRLRQGCCSPALPAGVLFLRSLSSGLSLAIPQTCLTLDFREMADHSLRTPYDFLTQYKSHRVDRGHLPPSRMRLWNRSPQTSPAKGQRGDTVGPLWATGSPHGFSALPLCCDNPCIHKRVGSVSVKNFL